jgi:hypothetical protein
MIFIYHLIKMIKIIKIKLGLGGYCLNTDTRITDIRVTNIRRIRIRTRIFMPKHGSMHLQRNAPAPGTRCERENHALPAVVKDNQPWPTAVILLASCTFLLSKRSEWVSRGIAHADSLLACRFHRGEFLISAIYFKYFPPTSRVADYKPKMQGQ